MDDEFRMPILVIGLTAALFVIAACVMAHNYRAYTLKCGRSGGVMVRDQNALINVQLSGGGMNDRELLVLAAKAAGFVGYWGGAQIVVEDYGTHNPALPCSSWNPIIDDGDALRLAIYLKIDIEFATRRDGLFISACNYAGNGERAVEFTADDEFAAARRAIVRAAAAMAEA